MRIIFPKIKPVNSLKSFWSKRKKLIILLAIIAFLILILPTLIALPSAKYANGLETSPVFGEFMEIDGVSTFVQVLGDKTKPAIIFVHGFAGSTFTWRKNLKPIADAGFYVVALDLKGFGLTEKLWDTNYSHPAQAEFIYNVMQKLEISKATLVGHSMGGNVVLHFANKYPEAVEKIVLVAPAISEAGSFNTSFFFDFYFFRQIERQIFTRIFSYTKFEELFKTAYFDAQKLTKTDIDGYYLPLEIKNWDLAFLGAARDSYLNKIDFDLKALDKEILLIWGENDQWIKLSEGMELNIKLNKSVFKIIREAGHLLMEEQAEIFNSLVVSFLFL